MMNCVLLIKQRVRASTWLVDGCCEDDEYFSAGADEPVDT